LGFCEKGIFLMRWCRFRLGFTNNKYICTIKWYGWINNFFLVHGIIIKRKFKHVLQKKIWQHGVGNPGHGLGQTQKYGRVKPVNWILNPHFLILGSKTSIP
jgi:hypothetical protein